MDAVINVFFESACYDTMEQIRTMPSGIVLDFSMAIHDLTIPQIKRILRFLLNNDVNSYQNVREFDRFISDEARANGLFDLYDGREKKLTQYEKRLNTILSFWDGELRKREILLCA